jgi:short-subunit dehydrogenase
MDKLIVVTGGTKGIGKAIIEKFASVGFDVVTCARHEDDLQNLKVTLEKKYPGVKVHTHQVDMADKQEVIDFAKSISSMLQPVNILVNNAGFFLPGEICTEKDGTLESMIDTNLYSAYYTTRSLVPAMKQQKRGHIFNICSIASITAYPNGGSYAISKFAMLGFSKCLREELKNYNIRVTAVLPGATKTASWDGVDIPDDRFMKSEDVAETVYSAYILSERSVVEEIIIRPQLGDL